MFKQKYIVVSENECFQSIDSKINSNEVERLKNNIDIDVEKVIFTYNKELWLLYFAKGQYGLGSGGEVGLYVLKNNQLEKPRGYDGISLGMHLLRMDQEICKIFRNSSYLHYVKWGRYLEAAELRLIVEVSFNNDDMKKSLVQSLKKSDDYKHRVLQKGNSIFIKFDSPNGFYNTKKERSEILKLTKKCQKRNKKNCLFFGVATNNQIHMKDKIAYIKENESELFTEYKRNKKYFSICK